MKPSMLAANRASAHNHIGGTVRIFKRLLPIFLVPVLLAGVALARPVAQTGTNLSPALKISNTQFSPGYNHAPDQPRFYFGTVVRDTADEQGIAPGRWQAPPVVSLGISYFSWTWFSLLIPR
jgi:hypothetical protein